MKKIILKGFRVFFAEENTNAAILIVVFLRAFVSDRRRGCEKHSSSSSFGI